MSPKQPKLLPSYQYSGLSRKARQRRQRFWRGLKGLAILIVLMALFGTSVLAYGYFWTKKVEQKIKFKPKTAKKIAKLVIKPKPQEPIDVLLVGVDRRPNWRFGRADTIIFLRIDPVDKTAYMLSIPRDTRVAIPGRGLDKINHAWAYGNAPLLIETVQNFLDLPVNYYFQLDFASFEKVVNALGGINFYIDRGWYDGELRARVGAGTYTRDGKEALAIVRARHQFGGGDMARIKNQQRFLTTVINESMNSYTRIPQIANILAQDSQTNMDVNTMIKLGQAFVGAQNNLQIQTLPGKSATISKIYYIIPDQTATAALISDMVNKKPFPLLSGE